MFHQLVVWLAGCLNPFNSAEKDKYYEKTIIKGP